MRVHSFPPIADPACRLLILGSMPGKASLRAKQYYAHPQNAFWKLVAQVFDAAPIVNYPQRRQLLIRNHIALWDVLEAAERPGSLDSSIVHASVRANDFRAFFRRHPKIRRVFFNGRKSEEIYRRRVLPSLAADFPDIRYEGLPSTSPAHAGMSFANKLARWRAIRD